MKVLFINSVCGIRSTGRIVTDLARQYLAQGDDVRIAYGRENVPSQFRSISYRIGSECSVRINGAMARLLDNEGLNAAGETKRLIRWAEQYDPDLLWLHNLHGYYLNVELLFQWIKSRPQMRVRWTLHDCWAFTGHCAHFTMAHCTNWQSLCSSCPQSHRYPKSILLDRSSVNYLRKKAAFCGVKDLTLTVPSHWLAGLVKQSFLAEYPVEVVRNQIDRSVFKPTAGTFRQQYGLQNRRVVLGVASIWDDSKGYSDFQKLAGMLGEEYAVVLVGLSRRQLKKLPANIIGIERTNAPEELAAIYTAADVFVNLTYEDTYPTVNLEAQACGTPCLTYRTGGSTESVPPAHVVAQGDLDAMAARMKAICTEGER